MTPKSLIETSPIAAVISNPHLPDNPIIECNKAFEELTGYKATEILGRNCRFLTGPDTEPALSSALRNAIRHKRAALAEILNYKKDGTPFRNAVLIAPIFGDDGELEYYLGSQMEVVAKNEPLDRESSARAGIELLSNRQRDVLKLIAAGHLNKQIAYELSLSERTIKMHRSNMLSALGLKTTADLIRFAIEAGY